MRSSARGRHANDLTDAVRKLPSGGKGRLEKKSLQPDRQKKQYGIAFSGSKVGKNYLISINYPHASQFGSPPLTLPISIPKSIGRRARHAFGTCGHARITAARVRPCSPSLPIRSTHCSTCKG